MCAPSRPGRRAVLLGGLLAGTGLGLPGCALPPTAPPPGAGAVPRLADVPGYTVLPTEPEPACKQTAVAYVQAVLTTGTPESSVRSLESRLAVVQQPVEPAQPLLALLPPEGGSSVVDVVYPQYSGLTFPRAEAGVVVVADHLVLPAGADRSQVVRSPLAVDVRLRLVEGVWTVVQAVPGAPPPPAPALSPAVQAVLDDDRVVLPWPAEADLRSGTVPDRLARLLSALAVGWRLDVTVIRTGHPGDAFYPEPSTGHADGLAVDVRALDGVPVVDHALCPWKPAMEAALAAGAVRVWGPQNFGRGSFTDEAHQDHLHLALA